MLTKSPMGLIGCPASFQRLVEKIMYKLHNVIVYIEDLLIHSKAHEDHLSALDEVLQWLTGNNMKINLAEFHFGLHRSISPRLLISTWRNHTWEGQTPSCRKSTIPETKEEIKSFVGLCNFIRTHLKDFTKLCTPLNKATRKDAASNQVQSQEKHWSYTKTW